MYNIENAQRIDGWMFNGELLWLAEQASKHKRIIEVGSFLGRSTRAMADNTYGLIVCIDPWNINYQDNNLMKVNSFQEFKKNLAGYLEWKVIPYMDKFHIWTEDYLKYTLDNKPFDMIFIDGDHSYEAVKSDIVDAKKLVKNGLICGHDYGQTIDDVKRAVDEEFSDVNVHLSIWWKEVCLNKD